MHETKISVFWIFSHLGFLWRLANQFFFFSEKMMWGKQCIFPPNYSLLPVLSSEWVLHFNILTIHFICEIRTFTGVIGLFIFFTSTCFWTSVAITTSIIIISGNFVFKFIIVKIKVILMSWTTVSRSVNDDYIWYSYSKKDQNLDKNTYFSVELKNSYFLHWNYVIFFSWAETQKYGIENIICSTLSDVSEYLKPGIRQGKRWRND